MIGRLSVQLTPDQAEGLKGINLVVIVGNEAIVCFSVVRGNAVSAAGRHVDAISRRVARAGAILLFFVTEQSSFAGVWIQPKHCEAWRLALPLCHAVQTSAPLQRCVGWSSVGYLIEWDMAGR